MDVKKFQSHASCFTGCRRGHSRGGGIEEGRAGGVGLLDVFFVTLASEARGRRVGLGGVTEETLQEGDGGRSERKRDEIN